MTENKDALQEIEKILRQHIKVDATGLAPMVARAFVTGFDDAAEAISAWNARATPPAQDAMREALEEISDAHLGDQPATSGGSEYDWAVRHISRLRGIARAALSTPQPESVEAAVERVTYAIILGSSGERAADHAKEFQTANWEDARRSAIAVIKAMPAATTQPGPDSWVPADQFVTLRHERDGLRAALAEAIEVLRAAEKLYQDGILATPNAQIERVHEIRRKVLAKHGVGR